MSQAVQGFRAHMLSHEKIQHVEICPTCNKMFTRKRIGDQSAMWKLRRHQRSCIKKTQKAKDAEVNGPYKCKGCMKGFLSKRKHTAHVAQCQKVVHR